MENEKATIQEIYHQDYNVSGKDNLDKIPAERALFGVFAMVNDEPVNCRYVSVAENLQEAVRALYENPPSEAMKNFMRGPWVQMLRYELLSEASAEEMESLVNKLTATYNPKITEEGEYPGYYDA